MTRPGISESERGGGTSAASQDSGYKYTHTPHHACGRSNVSENISQVNICLSRLFAIQQQSRDGLVGIKMGDNDYYVAKYP